MTRARLCLIACLAASCGGNDTSSPTPVQGTGYPNMVGSWEGTFTVTGGDGGPTGSNTCRETWVISSQSSADFLGTFQTSGGTTSPCAQSGSINGIVTTGGAVTDIIHTAVTNPNTCTRVRRTAMAGVVTGTTLTAQSDETLSCSGTTMTRRLAVSMTKR